MPVSWTDIELLNAELAALDRAGLPLSDGLRSAAAATRRGRMKGPLEAAAKACESGAALGDVLVAMPGRVPGMFISLVRAGEAGGDMAAALAGMTRFLDRRRRIASALRTAAAYPVIVLTFALAMTAFLSLVFFPKYLDSIGRLHLLDQGAWARDWLLWSTTLQHVLVGLLAVMWCAVMALLVAGVVRSSSEGYHRLLLGLPLYGRVFRNYLLHHFAGVTGLLLGQGVPVNVALDNLAALDDSPLLRQAAGAARRAVEIGKPLSAGLEGVDWFPPSERWLMAHAEKQERLQEYLDDLADRTAVSMDRSEGILRNLEPSLIGGLAIVIGIYCIAVFLPMVSTFKYIRMGE